MATAYATYGNGEVHMVMVHPRVLVLVPVHIRVLTPVLIGLVVACTSLPALLQVGIVLPTTLCRGHTFLQ